VFFIAVFFWVNIIIGAHSPQSVDLNNRVYPFLERMQTLGLLEQTLGGIRPFSRNRVAGLLKKLNAKRGQLTAIDRRRLDNFLLDFRWELDHRQKNALVGQGRDWYSVLASFKNFKKDFRRFFKQKQPEEQNHVLLWEKENDNFYFDYEQSLTYEKRSDNVYRSASWQTYKFRGILGERFAYRAAVSLIGLRGDEEYAKQHPILKRSWTEKPEQGPVYADRSGGELAYASDYFTITFAQQEAEWGYGESGKLILSRNVEAYPYLSISKDWGWGRFIALHGKLQSFLQDTLADGYLFYPDKWLAAHRLEISPLKKVTLGFNENFIYGNRYADWAYLIPFNFYRAVQHKLRDRDNATISLDFEWLPFAGSRIYGTLLLDEFMFSRLTTNWYGNKQAFQIGLVQEDPFHLPNLSLCLEYTAIMPWVYTHKYLVNAYVSDNNSLGYWAGPNSEVWYFRLRKDWHQRLNTAFKFRQWKHGANYPNENIGGDILEGHETLLGTQTKPKSTRKFLEGILTTEKLYQGSVEYEMFNDFYLSIKYSYIHSKTGKQNTKLKEWCFGIYFKY